MRKRLHLDWLVELFDCDSSSPDRADAFYPWSAPAARRAAAAEGAAEPRRGVSKPRCLPKVEGLLTPILFLRSPGRKRTTGRAIRGDASPYKWVGNQTISTPLHSHEKNYMNPFHSKPPPPHTNPTQTFEFII